MKSRTKLFLKLLPLFLIFLGFFTWGGHDYFAEKILTQYGKEIDVTILHREFVPAGYKHPDTCWMTYGYIVDGKKYVKQGQLSHLEYCQQNIDSKTTKAIYWPSYPSLIYLSNWKLDGTFLFWFSIFPFFFMPNAIYEHKTGKDLSFNKILLAKDKLH